MEKQFLYKAWANAELIDALALVDSDEHPESWRMAVRLLNHTLVVDRIFAAHLTNEVHPFTGTNTPKTPSLEQLKHNIKESDQWYVEYASSIDIDSLKELISFNFTDGDKGSMTREEVLTHIVVHGAYHRGNVGVLLSTCGITRPSDTYTRFLHMAEPGRRVHK